MPIDNSPKKSQLEVLEEIRDASGGGGTGSGSIGLTTDVAATSDTGTFSLISLFKRSLTSLTALLARFPTTLGQKTAAASFPVVLSTAAGWAQVDAVRAANVTTYTAGDTVGPVLTFPDIGVVGSHCMLTSVDLRPNISAIPAGMTGFRLYLYRGTPPSALADNAAWDLPAGDRSVFVGYIDLAAPSDLGSTLFSQLDSVNKQIKLGAAETSLYGYLVTLGSFTPAANSETFTVTLRSVSL